MSALTYAVRCWLCELLTAWALKCAPKGYTPGMVEACVDAYRRDGTFAAVRRNHPTGKTT